MADFCTQCSIHFGAPEGWSDFGNYSGYVICEGCDLDLDKNSDEEPYAFIINGRCEDVRCKCCKEEVK